MTGDENQSWLSGKLFCPGGRVAAVDKLTKPVLSVVKFFFRCLLALFVSIHDESIGKWKERIKKR
jgi:hypothetical protein